MDRLHIRTNIIKAIKASLDGYKFLNKLCYNDLFAFCKHLEDIYYSYIVIRVNQPTLINVSLWVGPIDRPDDGLYSLSANLELNIIRNIPYDNQLLEICINRLKNILDSDILSKLIIASKKELSIPSFGIERNCIYNNFLFPFFQSTIAKCNDIAILRNKKKIAPVIIEIYNELNPEQKKFFHKIGKDETVNMIWELCYIYSYK